MTVKYIKKGDKNMSKLINKNAGIYKTKVDVSQFFNDPEGEQQEFWILFRENNQEEAMSMAAIAAEAGFSSKEDAEKTDEDKKQDTAFTPQKAKAIKELNSFLKNMIIDHNFENEDGSKMKTEELWNLINERPDCLTLINEERNKKGPLVKKSTKK